MQNHCKTAHPSILFIDPLRQPPRGAVLCRTVREAIAWLKTGHVECLDVCAQIGVYGPTGELSIFDLAFALRELIASTSTPAPVCTVHGGTVHENVYIRKLLAAAVNNPSAKVLIHPNKSQTTTPGRDFTQLNTEEIARLKRLNSELSEVQRWVLERSRDLIAHWRSLPHRAGADLEIEPAIRFILRADDPRFRDDEDNIIETVDTNVDTGLRKRVEDGRTTCYFVDEKLTALDAEDWNGQLCPPGLGDFRHCWLFRELYDHKRLTGDDLLSIGSVWVDLCSQHQCIVTLDQPVRSEERRPA